MDEDEINQALAQIQRYALEYRGPNRELFRQVADRAAESDERDAEHSETRAPKERFLDAVALLVGAAFPATEKTLDEVLEDLTELSVGPQLKSLNILYADQTINARAQVAPNRNSDDEELFRFFSDLLRTPGSSRGDQNVGPIA